MISVSMTFPSLRTCFQWSLCCSSCFDLQQVFAESGVFARRANVQNGHALKFFGGVAVLAHGGVVYLEKAQRFLVEDPGGKRVVVEK